MPNQSSPAKLLRYTSSDPVYTEKLGIRKNFDDYDPYKPEDPYVFSKDVFKDLDMGDEKDKQVFLERLQERYEKIYRQNYIIDRNDQRRYHTHELYPGMPKPGGNAEMPFVSDESIRDSQLLTSLISPIKNDIRKMDRSVNDESFREFKNLEYSQTYRSPKLG